MQAGGPHSILLAIEPAAGKWHAFPPARPEGRNVRRDARPGRGVRFTATLGPGERMSDARLERGARFSDARPEQACASATLSRNGRARLSEAAARPPADPAARCGARHREAA